MYSPFVRFIKFCHLINLSSSYQTSVVFSPLVIYSLFTLSSHPVNAPTVHITKHNSYSHLIVCTLSAPIHFPNSTGVFGHRAILTMGDRTVAGGFLIEQTDLFQIQCVCELMSSANRHISFSTHS